MNLTAWYPATIQPVHVGWYETPRAMRYWSGAHWSKDEAGGKLSKGPSKWRGLTAEVKSDARRVNWRNARTIANSGQDIAAKPKFAPPTIAPNVVPSEIKLGCDAACGGSYDFANAYYCDDWQGFPGYSNLAVQAQKPEFRRITEVIASEMTRAFIRVTGSQEDEKGDKVKAITAALDKFKVREVFKQLMEHDGFFGCGHFYADVKMPKSLVPARADDEELKKPLTLTPNKIPRGSLLGFKNVEPNWCYPYLYNSVDPLDPTFYKPQSWFVMGKLVHASRLVTLITRPVPDILKPAYNFGGLSLTQIADPYVANWLRTRDSVGDLIHSFSLKGIKTDMSGLLEEGAACDVNTRLDAFNRARDNKGTMLLDKEEEFFQFDTSLSSLDKLQAQAQEQICSVSGLPLVKYTGITPSGLNASTDGEIRVFYDWIKALQEANFTEPLTYVLAVIQLHLFGEIDPDIGFEYVPLYQMTAIERADINLKKSQQAEVLIGSGVITPMEARVSLQADADGGYEKIDTDEMDLDTGAGGQGGPTDDDEDASRAFAPPGENKVPMPSMGRA